MTTVVATIDPEDVAALGGNFSSFSAILQLVGGQTPSIAITTIFLVT